MVAGFAASPEAFTVQVYASKCTADRMRADAPKCYFFAGPSDFDLRSGLVCQYGI